MEPEQLRKWYRLRAPEDRLYDVTKIDEYLLYFCRGAFSFERIVTSCNLRNRYDK